MCNSQEDEFAPEFQLRVNQNISWVYTPLLIDTPTRQHGLVNFWSAYLGVFTLKRILSAILAIYYYWLWLPPPEKKEDVRAQGRLADGNVRVPADQLWLHILR